MRENPEFMELRVKAMYELPKKKKGLWNKYNSAIVIEETDEYKNFDGDTVIRGCRVKININGNEECEYEIKGSEEGDINNNILSCDAPITQVLLGRRRGEKIEFNDMKIEILKVMKVDRLQ